MDPMLQGLALVIDPLNILLIFCGVVVGVLVGALPGLSSPMAVALLLPFTVGLEPIPNGAHFTFGDNHVGDAMSGPVLLGADGVGPAPCRVFRQVDAVVFRNSEGVGTSEIPDKFYLPVHADFICRQGDIQTVLRQHNPCQSFY